MPYAEGRVFFDADSHIMELPDFLKLHAEPRDRDLVPTFSLPAAGALATVLDDIPALAVTDQEASQLRLGRAILVRGRLSFHEGADSDGGAIAPTPVYCRSRSGDPIAITTFEMGELRPIRVFNFSH